MSLVASALALHVLLSTITLPVVAEVTVSATQLSTLYLPSGGNAPSYKYEYAKTSVKDVAVDLGRKLIYIASFPEEISGTFLHVVDAADPTKLKHLKMIIYDTKYVVALDTCGDYIAMAFEGMNRGILVAKAYDRAKATIQILYTVPVAPSNPTNLRISPNCESVVVACMNKPYKHGTAQGLTDEPGQIFIMPLKSTMSQGKWLDFVQFNQKFSALASQGVRWVYRQDGVLFANNTEPNCITFTDDSQKAYVSLSSNNAIAEIDMAQKKIIAVSGLGFKEWGEFDPSDQDGGVNIAPWPVYGMYQPSGIATVHWADQNYLITANAGMLIKYVDAAFQETKLGNQFQDSEIDSSVSSDLKAALKQREKLGVLQLSCVDGKNSRGLFEKFYTHGARSFSVFQTSDMKLVFDSGSDLENMTSRIRPDLFNNKFTVDGSVLNKGVDGTSPCQGPEPKSVAIGLVSNALLLFVSTQTGTIFVYYTEPWEMKPKFGTLLAGVPKGNQHKTLSELYDKRLLAFLPAMNIKFLPPGTLAEYPILLATGDFSGTVTTVCCVSSESSSKHQAGLLLACLPQLCTVLCLFLFQRE